MSALTHEYNNLLEDGQVVQAYRFVLDILQELDEEVEETETANRILHYLRCT